MAKRGRTPQVERSPWERRAALGLVLVTLLALVWLVHRRPPLGVPGQHAYGYHPAARWRAVLWLAIASVPLGAALAAVAACRRALASRRGEWALVTLISVGCLALHVVAATSPKAYPGLELAWPFLWTNTEGAYAEIAGHVGRLDRFVSNYVHTLDVSPNRQSPHWVHIHHGQVHPPGLILLFAGTDRFYEACPGVARAVTGLSTACFPGASDLLTRAHFSLRHPLAVAMTAAAAGLLMASLAPLACYLALRGLWPREAVLAAVLLAALVPGTYLFNPSVDQAYPVVVFALLGLGLRAGTTGRWGWGAAFGAVLYAAAFAHVGLALVAGVLVLAGLLAWRAWRPEWGLRQLLSETWRPAFAAVLGFLTPAFLLQVWLGYPTFRVVLACLRNNRLFNAAIGRTYWPWVVVTPLEFALSLGVALGAVCLVGWGLEVASAVRARSLQGRNALLLATVGTLALLDVLGVNRGESARLWLFVTPLLVAGVAPLLCQGGRVLRPVVVGVAVGQWLHLVVLRVLLDPNWTSAFLLDLAKQSP
ncbi:MAG: hypothetical protein ACODAJ_02320 [Planctomycetota bacterium]